MQLIETRTNKATKRDFQALLRVLKYIVLTKHLGLVFRKTTNEDTLSQIISLCGYVDASYAMYMDGRGQSGYLMKIGEQDTGSFLTKSNKQAYVALSSTESEIIALTEIEKCVIWVRNVLNELGFTIPIPTRISEDNKSAITLIQDFSGNFRRVRHFVSKINFLMEKYKELIFKLEFCTTEDQVADILTKPLGPTLFIKFRNILLGRQ